MKHCKRNAVYNTKAMEMAMRAYMNMFSSGWRNRFFRSHSRTSSSDSKSPERLRSARQYSFGVSDRWNALTSINTRETLPEVDDSRQLCHSPFPCVARVRHLDERDVQVVRFAVDVFQFLKHQRAVGVIRFVCQNKTLKDYVQPNRAEAAYRNKRPRTRSPRGVCPAFSC